MSNTIAIVGLISMVGSLWYVGYTLTCLYELGAYAITPKYERWAYQMLDTMLFDLFGGLIKATVFIVILIGMLDLHMIANNSTP